MPRYIATGLDHRGRQRTEKIQAATATEALEMLLEQGLTEVRLLHDDLFCILPDSAEAQRATGQIKAGDQYRLATASRLGARLITVGIVYRKNWGWIVMGLLLIAMQRLKGGPLNLFDVVGILTILLPALIVFLLPSKGPKTYDRLLRASVNADWERVLQLLPALRKALKPMGREAAEMETELWRAKALAATGRMDEAMEIADGIRSLSSVSPALADRRISEVCFAAHDFPRARELLQRAAGSNPEDAAAWFGLAEVLAVRLDEPQLAAQALARATSLPLAELTEKLIAYVEGAIALCEHRCEYARDNFAIVIETLRTMPNPLARALEYQTFALLAITEAQLGNRTSAEANFQRAESFLRAHDDHQMLERCQQALNASPAPVHAPA